jgi:hypothetical protein
MFEKRLLDIIEKDCRQVKFDEYTKRKTWFSKLIDWTSYQMIRGMSRLMFTRAPRKSKPSPPTKSSQGGTSRT